MIEEEVRNKMLKKVEEIKKIVDRIEGRRKKPSLVEI